MKYKISKKSMRALFSELYEEWPHCNFVITYSDYDKELETHLSLNDLLKKISDAKHGTQLGFYIEEMKGFLEKRKIMLEIKNATSRYTLLGWGLIIFNIQNKKDGFEIECGVNSEKRANTWYRTYPKLKEPKLWDWDVVGSTHRSIDRIIKKFA